MGDLKGLDSVVVFRPGIHNRGRYTDADMDEIVSNFGKLKDKIRPKLKISHEENQRGVAGLASYGDIKNVTAKVIDGVKHLLVDFANVPKQVADWIKERRFPERSVEIYPNINIEGTGYKNVLRNVSFLGHQAPAVPGLEPVKLQDEGGEYKEIVSVFSEDPEDEDHVEMVTIIEDGEIVGDIPMTAEMLEELEYHRNEAEELSPEAEKIHQDFEKIGEELIQVRTRLREIVSGKPGQEVEKMAIRNVGVGGLLESLASKNVVQKLQHYMNAYRLSAKFAQEADPARKVLSKIVNEYGASLGWEQDTTDQFMSDVELKLRKFMEGHLARGEAREIEKNEKLAKLAEDRYEIELKKLKLDGPEHRLTQNQLAQKYDVYKKILDDAAQDIETEYASHSEDDDPEAEKVIKALAGDVDSILEDESGEKEETVSVQGRDVPVKDAALASKADRYSEKYGLSYYESLLLVSEPLENLDVIEKMNMLNLDK